MIDSLRQWLLNPSRRRRAGATSKIETMETRVLLAAPQLNNLADAVNYNAVPGADEPLVLDSDATVTDGEGNYAGGFMTVHVVGASSKDKLGIATDGLGISTNKRNVLFNGSTVGTFKASKKGLSVDFNENISEAALNALLRSVTYLNTDKSPDNGVKNIQFQLTDGAGESSSVVSKSVNVQQSFNGTYEGSFKGSVSVEGFGTFPIPNPVVLPKDDAVMQITINGNDATLSIPAFGVSNNGTVGGTSFSGSAVFEFEGIAVKLDFTGEFKLKGKGATLSGTWAISDTETNGAFLNGNGTWFTTLQ